MTATTPLIPPHDIKIEESILGSMIATKQGLDDAMQILKDPTIFFKPEHIDIFFAIQQMYTNSEPIDLETLSAKMRALKKPNEILLIELVRKTVSAAHIEYHCRLLLQFKMRRMIVLFNAQITAMAMDESIDVFDLMARWTKEFDTVNNLILTGRKTQTIAEALFDLGKRIELISKSTTETPLTGIHTGFKRINHFTGGYQPQDLVILAARPGMGKTAKALKTVVENAKINVPVGIISLEMSVQQIIARIVAIDTNFHLKQLLKTGFDKLQYFDSYHQHTVRIAKYPIYMDDSGNSDITDIIILARMWKRKYGIKLLVIDYLQLMTDKSRGHNRENEVSSVSRRLKLLAKELEIPVIVLAQLSRAVETRGATKRPMLSDIRESGSIEQDADIVEFIYRPEYYSIDAKNWDEEMVAEGANTEIIFAKYRAGSIGTTYLKWLGNKTKFIDPTDDKETENQYKEEVAEQTETDNDEVIF
ncbi:replicative DNA helicase [Flavobacterium sp. NKUCC04_CG]|uniref:replicative DNA helicase n=1 Tax=Flavobacterium sp. NKUCC04_CG TaxID=2842121 RepID=UPI001C5B97E1|nr:replicative DNA helicase [Flavobacterium sp. NKUCC04_CG]MBW3518326.1 replicative DNA helicase [Flavobacterium sp. NKUCC04_CG]